MAKVGEGDARWIVSDRQDGTNVNQWHWQETDVLLWCQHKVNKEVLCPTNNIKLREHFSSSSSSARRSNSDQFIVELMEAKTTGEAYINTRKGKLIAGYELKVVLPFKAKRKKDEVMCEGTMEFPYVGDENADEDVEMEVRVATGTERALGDAAKQEILRVHRPKLVEEMNAFVEVLSKGGPALEKGATPQSVAKTAQTEKPAPAAKQEDPKREAKEKPKAAEGTKTIEFKEEFYCRPRDLYECYMDQGRVMAYTRSECRIVPVAGEPFTMFGGAITGVQVELVPEKRIVQRWRSSSWPEGVTSLVTMTFEEPSEGRTVLKLTQTGIPEEDAYGNANAAEVALQGWRQQIWGRVRQCFGYGC